MAWDTRQHYEFLRNHVHDLYQLYPDLSNYQSTVDSVLNKLYGVVVGMEGNITITSSIEDTTLSNFKEEDVVLGLRMPCRN